MVTPDERKLTLRKPDACGRCAVALPVGSLAWYRKADKSVACQSCAGKPEPITPGAPGASALAEYEKRRRNRERRTRAAHPHLGGLIVAFREPPASEEAWRIGAEGEQQLAAELTRRLVSTTAALLHDRRIPGSRANIDHIVIAATGVYVIDAKRYSGRIERRVDGGLFHSGRGRLFVNGRDKTKLVEGIRKQADIIEDVLADLPGEPVPVHPILCFIDGHFPQMRPPVVNGVPVLWPKSASRRIARDGPIAASRIADVSAHIAARLPACGVVQPNTRGRAA